jgi:hypothetical protein
MLEGTPESPWRVRTPSGGSEYEAWRDESLDPPAAPASSGPARCN